jgi:hypothetical protein
VLLSAEGVGTNAIMRETGKSKTCVWRWQERFAAEGFEGLLREANVGLEFRAAISDSSSTSAQWARTSCDMCLRIYGDCHQSVAEVKDRRCGSVLFPTTQINRRWAEEITMMQQIVIDAETPDDSGTLFRLRIDANVIAEGMTKMQTHLLVGEILKRTALSKSSAGPASCGLPRIRKRIVAPLRIEDIRLLTRSFVLRLVRWSR